MFANLPRPRLLPVFIKQSTLYRLLVPLCSLVTPKDCSFLSYNLLVIASFLVLNTKFTDCFPARGGEFS